MGLVPAEVVAMSHDARTCSVCRAVRASGLPPYYVAPEHIPVPPSMEPVEQSETVMAHRLWRWTATDGLIGPSGQPWKKSFMRAVCLSYDHPAPRGWEEPGGWEEPRPAYKTGRNRTSFFPGPCWCGINAYKLTEAFNATDIAYAPGDLPVLGIVELGGIVDEYDRGYRAEYGQIQELTVLTGLPVGVSLLEEKYDVPVRTMSFEDWRKEWELTYGRDRAESSGDRESGETDQNTQAGTPANIAAAIRAVAGTPGPPLGTTAGAGAHYRNLTLWQTTRLLQGIRNTPEPKWYRRWWWAIRYPAKHLPPTRWELTRKWLAEHWRLLTAVFYVTASVSYFIDGRTGLAFAWLGASGVWLFNHWLYEVRLKR